MLDDKAKKQFEHHIHGHKDDHAHDKHSKAKKESVDDLLGDALLEAEKKKKHMDPHDHHVSKAQHAA